MSKIRNTKTAKAIAGFVSALTGLLMLAPAVGATTTAELQAQITALLAQISSLQSQLGTSGSTTTTGTGYVFNTNLKMGMTGTDVMNLQKVLNMSADTQVSMTGAGSPGNESTYFGAKTKAAVIKFQDKYAADILTPVGLTKGTGYVGASTRAKLNMMGGTTTGGTTGGTTTGGTTTGGTTATSSTLMVSAAAQPMNGLAVTSAARVPFTTFTVTAGSSDVTVTGVNVTRTGQAQDAAFAGVVLLDSDGTQIGIAKTFGSNHQAVIGDTFTVKAGTSKTLTVAGNMGSSLSAYAGQIASLTVTGLNTSATVSGTFPITGASHTINSTLTIGTVTIGTSSFDPNNAGSQPIGTTNFRFTGFRITAGSAEDVTLKSIRWNQSGSVGSSDLANVVTVVNGTSYPTTVSADGKYFSTIFPNGILISKGNSVDVYVQGDVIGGAGRVAEFDIYKNTDLYLSGNTYGYGITPPVGTATVSTAATHGTTINASSNPRLQGSTLSVTAGSVTTIAKANEIPAQNIAVNVPNQVLGGYATSFAGEPVSVQSSVFTVASTTGSGTGLLTNVSIYDENGSVVAGPVDATYTNATTQTLTFTDTITYPVGRHVYTLKGKVASTIGNGGTYIVSTTPSSGWTSVTGQTTGNQISLSSQSTAVTMNTMTVKAAAATIGISPTPAAQTVVAGSQNFVLANFQIDATQSGEDIRLSSFPVKITTAAGGLASDLTGCQLWDGTTALNTGSNVVNSFTSGTAKVYSLSNSLVVPKNTVKTLALSCNVSSAAATGGTYVVNADTTDGDYTITGSVSGNSVSVANGNLTLGTSNGGTMTVGASALSVTSAAASVSQPSLTPAAAGSTGVTIGSVKLHATNDNVTLTKLGLTLANGKYGTMSTGSGASSASGTGDVMMAYIYNGATQVGTASFTGSNTTATSTLNLVLPRDTDTILTIKADLGTIGVSSSAGIGDTLKIDPLNAEGSGAASGATIKVAATAGVNGVQIVKSYPTVAFVSNSTNPNGSNVVLKKFTVTANASGPVSLYQMVVALATSSANVTSVKLFAYTDSGYSQGVSSQSSGTGQIGSTACSSGCGSNSPTLTFTTATNPVTIPAGTTYYFALLGTVTPGSTATNWTVTPTLQGDSAAQINLGSAPTYIATTTANVSTANFVWSDNATTTPNITTDVDWFNGYQVPGLPGTGI